jgi:hypothetical protein
MPMSTRIIVVLALLVVGIMWLRRRRRTTYSAVTRDRAEILNRVRQTWMKDVLDASLGIQARIALGLAHWPQPVLQSRMTLRRGQSAELLPLGIPIREVFDHVDAGLLILGPPGAGKTTALLELARDLLDRADHDAMQPIPVVLSLSSWAPADPSRPGLAGWLIEELHHNYDLPRRTAEEWVTNKRILPLLDDLDEVAPSSRADCVAEINEFQAAYPTGVGVCCGGNLQNDLCPRRRSNCTYRRVSRSAPICRRWAGHLPTCAQRCGTITAVGSCCGLR